MSIYLHANMYIWGQGELNSCNKIKLMISEIDNRKSSNANQLFYNIVINVRNSPKNLDLWGRSWVQKKEMQTSRIPFNELSYIRHPSNFEDYFVIKELTMSACSVASVVSSSLWPHGLQPTRLFCPWNSPGKNTRVGCRSLLQGVFHQRAIQINILPFPRRRSRSRMFHG